MKMLRMTDEFCNPFNSEINIKSCQHHRIHKTIGHLMIGYGGWGDNYEALQSLEDAYVYQLG